MIQLSMANYDTARIQQLFKKIIYEGAVATLLDIEIDVVKEVIADQFKKKPNFL